jgi:hypothetical protein
MSHVVQPRFERQLAIDPELEVDVAVDNHVVVQA